MWLLTNDDFGDFDANVLIGAERVTQAVRPQISSIARCARRAYVLQKPPIHVARLSSSSSGISQKLFFTPNILLELIHSPP
jgi:hypothetical protein